MKITTIITLSTTAMVSFIISYFTHIVVDYPFQYVSVILVTFVDGFFGMWAGVLREGFKTYKAINVLKTLAFWVMLLTAVLSIEKGFMGVSWLSTTMVAPFLVFQLISALKNASKIGLIHIDSVNSFLEKVDKHKDSLIP
jgi:hypothetical protein